MNREKLKQANELNARITRIERIVESLSKSIKDLKLNGIGKTTEHPKLFYIGEILQESDSFIDVLKTSGIHDNNIEELIISFGEDMLKYIKRSLRKDIKFLESM